MIVKSKDVVKKKFCGVDLEVLAFGQKSMVTKMVYKIEDEVPFHKHENEQSGYVISGKYIILISDVEQELNPGDSYSIPSNVKHTIKIIEPGEVLDFFTPPRKDYL